MKNQNEIWFDKPASHFAEALPIGNGRLGAVLFGGREEDHVILNESGMWSGSPGKYDKENRSDIFLALKNLLIEGKNKEAEQLYEKEFTSRLSAEEEYAGASSTFGCYQTLGTLRISMHQNMSSGQYSWLPQWSQDEDFYHRGIILEEGIHHQEYFTDHVRYKREALASYPHQIIALRYTADRKKSISMSLRMDRGERFTVAAEENDLLMTGYLEDGMGGKGVAYACRVRANCQNGTMGTDGSVLTIKNADEVTLYIAAATDIHSFAKRKTDNPILLTKQDLENIKNLSWEDILFAHEKDYQDLYERTRFTLRDCQGMDEKKATDRRLREVSSDHPNHDVIPLFFNYGKYLYISANREGGFPSNLQGIWAQEIQTMFNGDWHLDAQQENHWLAEPLNMPQQHETYLKLAAFLQDSGARTAHEYYGAGGWAAHIFTNPWGFTAPGAKAFYGAFMGGSGWLCQHLWDHYLYNEDDEYLKWVYPIIKGAAQFYLDVMFEEPEHGWLVTGPTVSPENTFLTEEGDRVSLCMGASCDTQIIRYLFHACVQASKLLNTDSDFRNRLEETVLKLPPIRVDAEGKIMEWLQPYRHFPHRHISHLWGLYPGNEITPDKTPELARAAWKVIDHKTAATGGWAIAHRMIATARLKKGDEAEKFLLQMLSESLFPNMLGKCHQVAEDGFPHPHPSFDEYRVPFQIDGNFACTAGIAEMFLQSHETYEGENGECIKILHILPALPQSFKSGEMYGLRARGNITVSMEWEESMLRKLIIICHSNVDIFIKYQNKQRILRVRNGDEYRFDQNLCDYE